MVRTGLSHWIKMTFSPQMFEERERLPEEDQSQKLQHKPALEQEGEVWDEISRTSSCVEKTKNLLMPRESSERSCWFGMDKTIL